MPINALGLFDGGSLVMTRQDPASRTHNAKFGSAAENVVRSHRRVIMLSLEFIRKAIEQALAAA
jgi:hypothetical protein